MTMYHPIKRLITLLLMLELLLATVWAEQIERRTPASEIETTQFEQNLEQRLSRDVRAYLNHDFFIIQVEAQLESIDSYELSEENIRPVEPDVAAQPQARLSARSDSSPSQQEIISQMALDTADGITQGSLNLTESAEVALPGLPMPETPFQQAESTTTENQLHVPAARPSPGFFPQIQLQPPVATKKVEKFIRSRIELGKQFIKLMLDDHVTAEQQVFIKNLIIEKAGVSFIRGDELTMLRSAFPGAVVLDEPVAEELEAAVDKPADEETIPQEPEPKQDALSWVQNNGAYLLIGLLLLLLLWLMLRRSKVATAVATEQSGGNEKFDALVEKLSQRENVVNSSRVQSLHEELVSLAATRASLAAELINELLANGGEQELEKAACLHHHLGQALFNSLLSSPLAAEHQIALAAKAQQYAESTTDNQLALTEDIYQSLVQRQYQQKNVDEVTRPFHFLERLNDDQIIYLLSSEDIKVKALVFSQLSAERGAVLLKRLKDSERSQIALQISRFDQMPVSAFQDIANRLAKNAINVPSFSNVAVDGVELLVDMLDHMDSAEETALLASIKRDNPDLFYQIKRVYLGFEDIVHMPELALKNLIRESEREQLALALHDMDDEFKFVIFNAMLERPRAMLQSLIQNIREPDRESVNQAKRVIARQARAMLKAGVFSMPDDDLESDLSL